MTSFTKRKEVNILKIQQIISKKNVKIWKINAYKSIFSRHNNIKNERIIYLFAPQAIITPKNIGLYLTVQIFKNKIY